MSCKKGFTLIELLVYASMFIVLVVFFTAFVMHLLDMQSKIKISKEVSDNSQRAMEIMTYEIKHALDIYQPTSLFASHPGQLSLVTKNNLPSGETTAYLDFYLDDNNRLCLKREGHDPEPLTSDKIIISNLVFDYLSSGNVKTVRIHLLANYNWPNNEKIYYQATTTLISSVNLRYE